MGDKPVPWVRFHAGRDYMRAKGWEMFLALFPAPDLMTRAEEGRMILCGLFVSAQSEPRFPWVSIRAYSDVNEITKRRAGDFSGVLS